MQREVRGERERCAAAAAAREHAPTLRALALPVGDALAAGALCAGAALEGAIEYVPPPTDARSAAEGV